MRTAKGSQKQRFILQGYLGVAMAMCFIVCSAGAAQLHYQARLTDPVTDVPREGVFAMTFQLYDSPVGGVVLWTETKDVTVEKGLFNTLLGDTVSLPTNIFDGRDLWLGITVGSDTEAAPRQPIIPGAYALHADDADTLDSMDSTDFADASHAHDGTDISGVVNESTIPDAIAWDSEVLPIVTGSDGPGSGLDADLLDGMDSTDFVSKTGPESISSASAEPTLTVTQSGDGLAGEFHSDTDSGLVGTTSSDVNYKAGVIGRAGDVAISIVGKYGVFGESDSGKGVTGVSSTDTGIFGYSISADAIKGQTPNGSGAAVRGYNTSGTGTAYGISGSTSSEDGIAVMGSASNRSGNAMGVKGESLSATGIGVLGNTTSVTGETIGVKGQTVSNSGIGVYGESSNVSGTTYGVLGESESDDQGAGVRGNGNYVGVWGKGGRWGLYGKADSGEASDEYSIYGSRPAGTGYAGYFDGNVRVVGSLSKGSGSFKIDHPLDPENKYLSHSFVESPDMMNVYNGTVVLDTEGTALVAMPDWFETLNRDFRYQLTAIGAPGPNLYVAEEMKDNRFRIAGGSPGLKVSWQVTGVRQDPYAEANRIAVEEDKPEEERGTYLHPEAYGLGAEKGLAAATGPESSR